MESSGKLGLLGLHKKALSLFTKLNEHCEEGICARLAPLNKVFKSDPVIEAMELSQAVIIS